MQLEKLQFGYIILMYHDLICHPSHAVPPLTVLFMANWVELYAYNTTTALLLSRFKIIPDPYRHVVFCAGISTDSATDIKNEIPIVQELNNSCSVVSGSGPDILEFNPSILEFYDRSYLFWYTFPIKFKEVLYERSTHQ